MRRITLALVATLAVLVLLFSYKTSRDNAVTTAQVTLATPAPAVATTVTTSVVQTTTAAAAVAEPTTTRTSTVVQRATAGSTTKATSSSTTTATTSTTTAAAPQVVTGAAADTRYGPVQVQITVQDGKITAVTAVEYPQENPRDAEIDSQAIPQLQAQALAAQSSRIDGVGGATFTTDGFEQSLQSAIDAAHLG